MNRKKPKLFVSYLCIIKYAFIFKGTREEPDNEDHPNWKDKKKNSLINDGELIKTESVDELTRLPIG